MAKSVPSWDDLTDHDKGAVIVYLRMREDEGRSYADENYPVCFRDNETLKSLSQHAANRYALLVIGTLSHIEKTLGLQETYRLYDLAC